ncbi:MAG TPA: hypothetical protein VKW06_06375 [Candidatus Angelobacter sp.]|nr:hypothetical protein [Candidatus Angelobacter sp.]
MTLSYAVILLVFVAPLTVLINLDKGSHTFVLEVTKVYQGGGVWLLTGIMAACQALLLFLSVDVSRQRLKPRSHILLSCMVTAAMAALLCGSAILSLGFGVFGDRFGRHFFDTSLPVFASWAGLWLAWGLIFLNYLRGSNASLTRITTRLLRGSVLELLIAVPSHVLARRRNDCSAPVATSFGIATGIAIMLLCFGPSVLLLYKKRMDDYGKPRVAAAG